MTALMYAAQGGHTEVVQTLLDKGGDTDTTNNEGKTAAKLAEEAGYNDVKKLIDEHPGIQMEFELLPFALPGAFSFAAGGLKGPAFVVALFCAAALATLLVAKARLHRGRTAELLSQEEAAFAV